MLKKLFLLAAVVSFISCNNDSDIGFNGKWVNIENKKNRIVISSNAEAYTVNVNDSVKYPAFKDKGILKIIVGNDTIDSKIDNENFLIIENESFKELNGRYTNPGAGVY